MGNRATLSASKKLVDSPMTEPTLSLKTYKNVTAGHFSASLAVSDVSHKPALHRPIHPLPRLPPTQRPRRYFWGNRPHFRAFIQPLLLHLTSKGTEQRLVFQGYEGYSILWQVQFVKDLSGFSITFSPSVADSHLTYLSH